VAYWKFFRIIRLRGLSKDVSSGSGNSGGMKRFETETPKHKAKSYPLRRDVCWCWFEVSLKMTIHTGNSLTKRRELLLGVSRGI